MRYCLHCPSLFIVNLFIITGMVAMITASEHRTKAASEKLTDLWCYKCDTMADDRCQNLPDNATILQNKCNNEHRICKVKRISMSTSTEDVTGKPKLWLLQRNCTKSCEPGCIVVGERTKLYSCTTCCETSLCNYGSGSEHCLLNKINFMILLLINLFIYLIKLL